MQSEDKNKHIAELVSIFQRDHVVGVETLFDVKLDDQQKALVRAAQHDDVQIAVKSGTGCGKAIVNGTTVHTPNGPIKVEDLVVGSSICSTYSTDERVLGVFPQGEKDCYRITFNDGSTADCSIDHIWSVEDYHGRKVEDLTLEQILDKGIYAPGGRLRWKLPTISPVYFDKKVLPIDPYILGVWLGDGCRGNGLITNVDSEVWESIEKDFQLGKQQYQGRTVKGLSTYLRKLGIIHLYSYQKYIPYEYKYSSIEDRLSVLQGLMDTDGTISSKGHTTFYSTSEVLAEDVAFIIRSLGGFVKSISTKKTTHKDCYTVHFSLFSKMPLFRIKRKLDRQKNQTGNKFGGRRYIKEVSYIGKKECTCISTSAKDSLYLIGDSFIPTHNTFCLGALTYLYLLVYNNVRILVASPSFSQLQRVYKVEIDTLYSRMVPEFRELFDITSEKIEVVRRKDSNLKPRVANVVTANASNPESLQGGHSDNYIILLDEASGVEDEVFKLLQRTLSYGKYKFICTSNPTRNSGYYYEIFNGDTDRYSHWTKLTFSGLKSGIVTKTYLDMMNKAYDKEDDQYKIGVLGEFGRLGENSFFSQSIIESAIKTRYDLPAYMNYPKIVGVDVASQGDDSSCFVTRQGNKIVDIELHKGLDPMELVAALVAYRHKMSPSSIFIDATGLGEGVYSRARELQLPVYPVLVAGKSPNPIAFHNLRAWLYGQLRIWLSHGADIPDNPRLKQELLNITSSPSARMAVQITSKKQMKSRGLPSPDIVDAISFTFMGDAYMNPMVVHQPREIKKSRHLWV